MNKHHLTTPFQDIAAQPTNLAEDGAGVGGSGATETPVSNVSMKLDEQTKTENVGTTEETLKVDMEREEEHKNEQELQKRELLNVPVDGQSELSTLNQNQHEASTVIDSIDTSDVPASSDATPCHAGVATLGLSGVVKKEVTNMEDNFAFFRQAVEEVILSDGHDQTDGEYGRIPKQDVGAQLEGFTLSTAYSGVGAPEATSFILHHHLQEICGTKLPAPRILHQVEIDAACRSELQMYHTISGTNACCFGDMNAFYIKELQETIAELKARPELSLEVLSHMVASGEACKRSAYCYTHSKVCEMRHGYNSIEWAGFCVVFVLTTITLGQYRDCFYLVTVVLLVAFIII